MEPSYTHVDQHNGGDRAEAHGCDPTTQEVQTYDCVCLHYRLESKVATRMAHHHNGLGTRPIELNQVEHRQRRGG